MTTTCDNSRSPHRFGMLVSWHQGNLIQNQDSVQYTVKCIWKEGQRFIVIQSENACLTMLSTDILQDSLGNSPYSKPSLQTKQNKKKAQLLCHMQAARDSEESLCHLVDCTTPLRLLQRKSLHHLLTDTVSSPCQAQERCSRVGFPDGSEPAEKCRGACRQSRFFNRNRSKKRSVIQHLGDLWRPLRASQNCLRQPLTGVSAPALKGELSFQIVINLQMLCKGICLDLQCAMCVHVNYVCGLLINKLVNFFHLVSLNYMPLCDEEQKEEIQQLDVCVFA